MQSLMAFARHGRNYIIRSSSSSSFSSGSKVFSSTSNLQLSSSTSCNSNSGEDDFQKVISLLSNAAPNERGHQIYSDLNSIQFTTLHHQQQQQQYLALKVIETSCQTKFVEAPKVQRYDLINYIKLVWKNNKDLITTPVLESLVSSICSTVPTPPGKNDILFLWDLLKRIGLPARGILNARILNKLIQSFSVMGQEGKAALDVFNKFEVFQCVPNHDTYYFTLQALLSTGCSADMIEQAASICQKMLLLLPRDHDHDDAGYSSSPPSRDKDIDHDFTDPKGFQTDLTFLGGIPRPQNYGCVCANVNLADVKTMRQQLHHFVLKVIETSSQTKLIETSNISPHNLIHFIKWAWRRRNTYQNLITTPVLESLVLAICDGCTIYDVHLRKNDIFFLWELLKHIGHYQTDLLNTRILNQLLHSFRFMLDQGKTALEVFHKFEALQCVPNQDTYTFTLQALLNTRCITDMTTHQAASICQKMLLHPETILPDNGDTIGHLLSLFSQQNMIKEAYALYMAANEKRKTNPNWSLKLKMLLPLNMIKILCLKKETVHLALEMLNDIPEVDVWEEWFKQTLFIHVASALCGFKDLEAAKQLILKMIAENQCPLIYVINIIITAYVKAGEIGQVLEMVMQLESIGVYICEPLMFGFTHSEGLLHISKILDKCKKEDSKLIVALLYHTLIAGYCRLQKFDVALKSLTRMKDFGVSHINLDEYQRLIDSLSLMAMDGKMAREQLEEMEPVDRKMAEKQLSKIGAIEWRMREEKLEEMYLIIKELF